jgi:streptogramin lyase
MPITRSSVVRGAATSITALVASVVVLSGVASAQAVIPRPSWHEHDTAISGGFPGALAADPSGGIWYADNANGEIVHELYETGETKTYSTGPLGYISHQVVGEDGRLWLSAPLDNVIASLDPATGHIEEFALAATNSAATGLDAAADGIWFVDPHPGDGRIGRIGYDGTLFSVDVPSTWVGNGIAVDDDGLVWSSDPLSTDVSFFDPATNVFTALDSATAGIEGFTASETGGVWAAGATGITRMTTAGIAETVDLPAGTSAWIRDLEEIPGGGLYFADFNGGLGWVDANGVAAFLAPPMDGVHPDEAVLTSDGLLWYLDANRGKVGWKL